MTAIGSTPSALIQPLVETRAQPLNQAPRLENAGNPFFAKAPELAKQLGSRGGADAIDSISPGLGNRLDIKV